MTGRAELAEAGTHVGLTRVLSDRPAAVLIVDLDAAQVVYANDLAQQLAPQVALPIDVDAWSRRAGLQNEAGDELEATSTPLQRVAAGQPVHGEIMTASRESDLTAAREELWVVGTPLVDAPAPLGRRALVAFLPLSDQSGILQFQVEKDLRHRAVVASELAFSISDPTAPDNPLVWVNPAFERLTGYAAADVVGRNCRFLQGPLSDRAAVGRIGKALRTNGIVNETLLNYRTDGTAFWNHLVISPIFDAHGRLTHHVCVHADVTARVDADAARDAALVVAKAATARQRAVSAISQELATRIDDPTELLADLPGIVVSHFPGWAFAVALEDGAVLDAAAACSPSLAGWTDGPGAGADVAGDELLPVVPVDMAGRDPESALNGLRTLLAGRGADLADPWSAMAGPVTLELTAAEVDELAAGAAVVPALGDSNDLRTLVATPMRARGRVSGLLLLSRTGSGHFQDPDELAVIADIGLRAGTALENAQLYAREHEAAITLQRGLLPHLPTLASFDVAAAYLPASAAEVGGDWYDVLDLPGPSVGVAVGDVMGHDLAAAAAMGQLRSMVRALAWAGRRPVQLVGELDPLVRGLSATPLATLFYAVLDDPADHNGVCRVAYTSAGHPPGLVRHLGGAVTWLTEGRTSPIGVLDDRAVVQAETELPAGGALVLYTDGLIERADADIEDRIGVLADVLAATPDGAPAADICASISAALIESVQNDDACVLVLSRPVPE
ncbi:SpoIIE family protein phosphatase [uncultured Jatrophihabitans sp.]|uniref:SpoIIE family protein phosphatase n=1 Tax=uncultured Jatrophihabitans sp. TaxID=1610747 RepID=UPI0035CC1E7E